MPGPKKPLKLHILQGTARRNRMQARADELQLPSEIPQCPKWLKGEARAEWSRLTNDAAWAPVLSKVHRGALTEYCVLWARMVAWAKGAGEISASERQTLHSLRMQLGITPASQSKVKMPDGKPTESKWERLASATAQPGAQADDNRSGTNE
jgi:phage terminase small subunit